MAKLTEIRKGDWIRSAYDELGLINKVKGQTAYVSFDGSRSFHPIRVADLKKTKEFHRGKAVYSEGKLSEAKLKKGDKVKYLGHPATITNVKDYNGKTYYSVSYNKGSGKTKASSILSTDGSITELNEFEGRPIPMDTPNAFAYKDFKKHAYKNRSQFKKDMIKHGGDGSKMFMTLSALWYKWAYHNNKEFGHIKNKLKFGRALMVMMVKDDLIFDKSAWKKDNKITHVKESKKKLGTSDEAEEMASGNLKLAKGTWEGISEADETQVTLPVDKPIVLRAGTDEHARGLIVTYKSSGGYDIQYWYGTPDKIVPAELKGDGKSLGQVKTAWFGYHPETDEGVNESVIGIKTKANFKPLQLKGALEKAGIKGFQMNRLSVTSTALKLDKKYFNDAKKIIDNLGLSVMMAKEGKLSEGSKANRWFDNLKYYYEKGLSSPDLKDPAEKKAYTKLAKQFFSKLREGKLTEVRFDYDRARDVIESEFGWNNVESEGRDETRFDFKGGRDSMWISSKGKVRGNIPRNPGLRRAIKDLGIKEGKLRESSNVIQYESTETSITEYDVDTPEELKEFVSFLKEYKSSVNEAEYEGRKVKLGKPSQGDVKKFKVYVTNPKGNVVKVNFGQKGMVIKKDNPGAKKSFRARHNCDTPGPRTKARYWSCRKW